MNNFFQRKKTFWYMIFDILWIPLSYYLIIFLISGSEFTGVLRKSNHLIGSTAILSTIIIILAYFYFKIYKHKIIYTHAIDFAKLIVVNCIAGAVTLITVLVFTGKSIFLHPYTTTLSLMLILFGHCFARVAVSSAVKFLQKTSSSEALENMLIVGAGNAAEMVVNSLYTSEGKKYNIIGFIDDDPAKLGIRIMGYDVLGTRDNITDICKEKKVDIILIAIPSINTSELSKIVSLCLETGCKVKKLPDIEKFISLDQPVPQLIQNIDTDDLLDRDPIVLDNKLLTTHLEGKVIMVTGGGGSIGSELCRQIAKYNPLKLIVYDIYENSAYDLQQELRRKYPYLDIEVIISSVRDIERLDEIFNEYKPNIVFHAAAHKHVPLMEANPGEAVKNNVFGTYNTAKCADKYNTEKFIMISTDKAVNPTNIMGATKRLCELIVQAFQQVSKTEFVAVRFGNVLGSNGSVVPLFKRQIENGGPVTVTHKEITRFFMTIPEAAQLVLQATTFAKGGEVFVLDMGKPVKIYNLAEKMIKLYGFTPNKDIKIEVTGLRPGEKLYEELLMDEEGLTDTSHNKIFIGKQLILPMEKIEEHILALRKAVDSKSNDMIFSEMARIVPTFKTTRKINK